MFRFVMVLALLGSLMLLVACGSDDTNDADGEDDLSTEEVVDRDDLANTPTPTIEPTAEPTPTPTPTSTPTPSRSQERRATPRPRRTPTALTTPSPPHDLSPSFNEYRALVIKWTESYLETFEIFGRLQDDIRLDDPDWNREAQLVFQTWHAINDEVQALTPPPQYEAFHVVFSEVTEINAAAADEFERGFEMRIQSHVDAGSQLIADGTALLSDATALAPSGPDDFPELPPTPGPVQLAWMFPRDDEFGVPVNLNAVGRVSSARPESGFIGGEEFTWHLANMNLQHQSFLLLEVTCVEYTSAGGATEWIDSYRDRSRAVLVGISRDEPIEGLGDEGYVMTGLFSSDGPVFLTALGWVRADHVACHYTSFSQDFDPTDQIIDIARLVEARVQQQRLE